MLGIEIKKLIKRREYKFIFILMFLGAVLDFAVLCYNFYGESLSSVFPAYIMTVLYNVSRSPFRLVFVLYLPLCVGFMGVDTYLCDRQDGINNYILTRCNRKKYIWNKALAIYIVTMLSVISVILINLLLAVSTFPVYGYDFGHIGQLPELLVLNNNSGFLDSLEIEKPYAGFLIFAVLRGVYAGLLALLAYGISLVIKINKYIVIASAFIVCEGIGVLGNLIRKITEKLGTAITFQNFDMELPLVIYPDVTLLEYATPYLFVLLLGIGLIFIGSRKEEL